MVYGGGRGSYGASRQPKAKDPSDEQFRKIFVGGLNLEVSTEGLREYFAKYGEIVDCIVVKNPKTQRSKGFGFLTFKEAESIDSVQAARPHVIEEKEVEVKRAMPRDEADKLESHVTTPKLFVGSLRNEIGDSDLKEYFSQYGDVEGVEFAKHKDSGESRGFAFVTFKDYDSVDKAMLNRPHTVKEVQLDVRKGLSREEMQKVRMRQQMQQQHQEYYNTYYDAYGAGPGVGVGGAFGSYDQGFRGAPVGRGAGVGAAAAGGPSGPFGGPAAFARMPAYSAGPGYAAAAAAGGRGYGYGAGYGAGGYGAGYGAGYGGAAGGAGGYGAGRGGVAGFRGGAGGAAFRGRGGAMY